MAGALTAEVWLEGSGRDRGKMAQSGITLACLCVGFPGDR